MSKLLIAIPAYNAEDFITRTLHSCVNQTVKARILVVDNCSTDNTREIVEKFQKQHDNVWLMVNKRNLGRMGNLNCCIDIFMESDYEYLQWCFTGDELLPECVKEVEKVFEKHDNLSVIVRPYLFRGADGSSSVSRILSEDRLLTREDMVNEGFFPGNFTGALICSSWSKRAIGDTRYNEIFIGGHFFSDMVVIRCDAYHFNKVLSVFNLDSRKTFGKQFNHVFVLEVAYQKCLSLEINKDWIVEEKYRSIRDKLIVDMFSKQVDYVGNILVFKLLWRLASHWFMNGIGWFVHLPKRTYRKTRVTFNSIYQRFLGNNSIKRTLARTPSISYVVLYANSFCNAHCNMCDVGVGSGKGIARPLLGAPKYLPLPLLEKILDDKLIVDKKLYINFLMTEPLLAPELPKMLELCKQRGHTVKITTNGFLLARRAKEISPYVDNVQVSLDGPEEIHDAIRGKGFFSAAIEGIRVLRDINDGVEIEINYTVSNLNYFCISNFMQLIDSLGIWVNLLKIQLMDFVSESMRDRHNACFSDIPQNLSTLGGIIDLNKIDIKELQRQLDLVRNFKPDFIKRIAFKPPVQSADDLEAYFNPNGNLLPGCDKCFTPWQSLAINTDGKVFWHMRCFNDYILGDVSQESLGQIFYGEKAENFRMQLQDSGFCFPACTRCCGVMPME